MPAWNVPDPTLPRPIAAPLERCAELLGVDLVALQKAAAHVEPYLRIAGARDAALIRPHLRNRVASDPSISAAGQRQ